LARARDERERDQRVKTLQDGLTLHLKPPMRRLGAPK
jgi:hypothetical protein